ncbi:DinB family protein [Mucilaginibacter limnophilus]|uniref:DinB family protein n=1 Tax=Mucilaginibacter limnophilus TaxID=1932778 RepID=A0A3S2Y2M3_9SPHI|nr:DinB family protein [Mucilaginibacter limnophilus]RVU02027.1 DinB family protein [Mucilaginibacter limnophilus]
MENNQELLIAELVKLLQGGMAHAGFKDAVEGLPADLRGAKPENVPYSIWQLVEHIRIAQWDMLEFSRDANHKSPKWPDEYWPAETAPAGEDEWNKSLTQIENDLEAFISLLKEGDLYKPFPHGEGQTLLREALQIADHTSYHTGEIIALRRILGAWK